MHYNNIKALLKTVILSCILSLLICSTGQERQFTLTSQGNHWLQMQISIWQIYGETYSLNESKIQAEHPLIDRTFSCSLGTELLLNSIMRLISINYLLHLLPVVWYTPVTPVGHNGICHYNVWGISVFQEKTLYHNDLGNNSQWAITDFQEKYKTCSQQE